MATGTKGRKGVGKPGDGGTANMHFGKQMWADFVRRLVDRIGTPRMVDVVGP